MNFKKIADTSFKLGQKVHLLKRCQQGITQGVDDIIILWSHRFSIYG